MSFTVFEQALLIFILLERGRLARNFLKMRASRRATFLRTTPRQARAPRNKAMQSIETLPPYSENDLRFWLALLRVPQIGALAFSNLLTLFPKLENLFSLSSIELTALGLNAEITHGILSPNWQAIDHELKWADSKTRHILTLNHPLYPAQLQNLKGSPPVLFVEGNIQLLTTPQLAIVGSRNPSPRGLEYASSFASQCAEAGLTITSGLALGIDTAAHQGSLLVQGSTIAVLGSGLYNIYPKSNQKLAEQIIENGALVSEFHLFTAPHAQHFPQRNRIVSGLSLGVLVVEAALRSGSLITARYAGEQGRDIFAIPGSIRDPLARGCHHLIRQGAKLVEKIDDILEEFKFLQPKPTRPRAKKRKVTKQNSLDANHQQLLQCMDYESASVEKLAQRSGLGIETIIALVTELEINGLIRRTSGNEYQLIRV